MMTLTCLSVHYCLGDLQVMMFAMSASVSVALQSVNLFVPCPLHCMFVQAFVSAHLDVFGWSYYLPVEIRLHVCLCTHACLVIQVLSRLVIQVFCLHKTQCLFAHLFTCPYMSVHVFFSHKSILVLHKVWSVFSRTCAQDTVSVCSCKCLPVCKTACLHICLFEHVST